MTLARRSRSASACLAMARCISWGRSICLMATWVTFMPHGSVCWTIPRAQAQTKRITELTKNLRLVGISWSADPDVMIEDTNMQRTFFLKKGQVMENINVKVEAVFKDKVVLSCDGEEAELR